MKTKHELILATGIVVLTIFLGMVCFGLNIFGASVIDFQFHERYVALPGFAALTFLFFVLFAGVVLARLIYRYSNHKALNIVCSLVIIYLIFVAWLYIDELNNFELYIRELYTNGVHTSDQKETFAGIENSRRFLKILMGLGTLLFATALFKTFVTNKRLITPTQQSTNARDL